MRAAKEAQCAAWIRPALRTPTALGALFASVLWAALACHVRPTIRVAPVEAAAADALVEAQTWRRAAEFGDSAIALEQARESAERAVHIAPDWIAPQRLLDDLAREELRGVEALESHRAALARDPDDARELYLAGRLEGLDGQERFGRAVRLEPGLAWGHHGLSWIANIQNRTRDAVEHARAALARARDPWERSFFTSALARALVALDRREEAARLLDARIQAADTSAVDRVRLAAESVEIGLEARPIRARIQSYAHGLDLLRTSELSESESESLVRKMQLTGSPDDPDGIELQTALATRSSPVRDRLRAELMLDAGSSPLALGLLQRALEAQGRLVPAGPLMRAARFAAGEYGAAVEYWLAALPDRVCDAAGLPLDPRLARIVRAARALSPAEGAAIDAVARASASADAALRKRSPVELASRASVPAQGAARDRAAGREIARDPAHERTSLAPPAQALTELAEALLAAGWFREARSVAERLARDDLDHALAFESRALAGLGLFEGIRRLLTKVDLEHGVGAPLAQGNVAHWYDSPGDRPRERLGEPSGVRDLDGLLARMGPLFARASEFLGGETDPTRMSRELAGSARMSYGPVGEIVHPGPWFSRDDAEDGLGAEDAPVPGLAAELARLGRFGLFGQVLGGGGPDGTILSRVGTERRAGVHLGIRWSGTVVWCEGSDLKSRAGRHGAHISAAALHEGYWLDIDAVRAESGVWTALRREFSGPESGRRIEQVLAVRGLRVGGPFHDARGRRERTRTGALLGEAQRVRLALLRDRGRASAGTPAGALGDVGIEELVLVTATHEEGHLCDRTRFLPVSRKLPKLLLFLLDCGFSPQTINETLEYRAQLVCIAETRDPRIALAQVLDAAEQGSSDLTPHAAAYATLLADLLDVLASELERDPAAFPAIDRDYTLAHQLHRLPPEAIRRLAVRLAHEKRIDR